MSTALGAPVLDPSLYIPNLKARRRDAALLEMVDRATRSGAVCHPALLKETLALRERAGSTAPGKGVAIPGARSLAVVETRLVVARSSRGLDWSAADEEPVHLVLLVLTPAESGEASHVAFLGRAASAVRLQRQRQKVLEAGDFDAIAAVLKDVAP